MYKCEICKSLIQRNIRSYRVVVETRRKTYPIRKKKVWGLPPNEHKYKWCEIEDTGYEIVKEKVACPDCEEKAPKTRRNG
jgi:hypothetical protein